MPVIFNDDGKKQNDGGGSRTFIGIPRGGAAIDLPPTSSVQTRPHHVFPSVSR